MKLTKRDVDRIALPTSGQIFHWDSELRGFGLRATPSRMTYIAQGRVQGRTVRVTLGRHGTLTPDMARTEARMCLADMDRGIDRNRRDRAERLSTVTLTQAYDAYVAAKPLAESTRRDYKRALNVVFAAWKDLPITKITGAMVMRRFETMSSGAPAQANQVFRFLRALLGWAMWKYSDDQGTPLVSTNPCDILTKLKRWNRVERRVGHIKPEQVKAFFDALAPNYDDSQHRRGVKDLCILLILTGLREQEGASLKWSDVDFQAKAITIRNNKSNREHTLPIGDWLCGRLQARKVETGFSEYVFPAHNRAGHLKYHRKDVLDIGSAASIDFRLHDLRRTFASIVNHHLERSLSAYTIKRLLNHSTGSDVTAGYIQHSVADLRAPMEMVESFVLKSAGLAKTATITPIRDVATA